MLLSIVEPQTTEEHNISVCLKLVSSITAVSVPRVWYMVVQQLVLPFDLFYYIVRILGSMGVERTFACGSCGVANFEWSKHIGSRIWSRDQY